MIVAIDVGLKRVGVAISPDGKIALPQNPIIRKGRNRPSKDVSDLVKKLNRKNFSVGIPLGGSSEVEMSRRIKHFVSLLNVDEVSIEYQNEADSSLEAKERMRGVTKQKRDGKVDSISASIILERWIDSKSNKNL